MPDEIRVEAARRYIASYEIVTGQTFEPDPPRFDPPHSVCLDAR